MCCRTGEVRLYVGGRLDNVDERLSDIDTRHSAQLKELDARTREILQIARTNERRIMLLVKHIEEDSRPEPSS